MQIILSVTLKFNWSEAWMDPPLRHWQAQTVESGRVSDGGEILAFDYAAAVRISPSPRAKPSLCFSSRVVALNSPNVRGVYYDLKAVLVVLQPIR